MTLAILAGIKAKKETFPLLNRTAIYGEVPNILKNFSAIKGRKFNRSVIYRQAGRDDYHQPSYLESFFDFWASTSFRSEQRGELLLTEINTWSEWRQSFESNYAILHRHDYWDLDEAVDTLLAKVRRCHMAGDVFEKQMLLIQIRDNINKMLSLTGASEIPAEARAG